MKGPLNGFEFGMRVCVSVDLMIGLLSVTGAPSSENIPILGTGRDGALPKKTVFKNYAAVKGVVNNEELGTKTDQGYRHHAP